MGIEGGRESQILAENKILKQRKREKRKRKQRKRKEIDCGEKERDKGEGKENGGETDRSRERDIISVRGGERESKETRD